MLHHATTMSGSHQLHGISHERREPLPTILWSPYLCNKCLISPGDTNKRIYLFTAGTSQISLPFTRHLEMPSQSNVTWLWIGNNKSSVFRCDVVTCIKTTTGKLFNRGVTLSNPQGERVVFSSLSVKTLKDLERTLYSDLHIYHKEMNVSGYI